MQQEWGSVPAVVFDHVVEFNDVLPLFVLLAALEGLFLKGGERPSSLEQGPSQQAQRLGHGYDGPYFISEETVSQRSQAICPQTPSW